MANVHLSHTYPSAAANADDEVNLSRHTHEAYGLLHLAFAIAPVAAGLDKFFHLLTDWDKYVSPLVARVLPVNVHTFMSLVGVIEIAAGLLVLFRPRLGAYVVAAWLVGIVLNLILTGGYLDIALRDVGLCLGALALARLSLEHDKKGRAARAPMAER